jgi:sucrose-6F-phosphate phosphohydrolase
MPGADLLSRTNRLLVSDVDGTLLDEGRPTAGLETLRTLVETMRPRIRLVYATGRTFDSMTELIGDGVLPRPDAMATSVGTELWLTPFDGADADYQNHISRGFNRERVMAAAVSFPQITPQPDEYQSPVKASFFLEDPEVVPRFEELLARADAGGRVIYSCDRFLDVLPRLAGKRNAVDHLCDRLGIRRSRVMVAGDSGNDLDMLSDPDFRAVAVGNAGKELECIGDDPSEHQSMLPHAAGVLEGAEVFGFWA